MLNKKLFVLEFQGLGKIGDLFKISKRFFHFRLRKDDKKLRIPILLSAFFFIIHNSEFIIGATACACKFKCLILGLIPAV